MDNRLVPATEPHPLERIRQLLGPNLEALAGAHAQGEIPIPDGVLNTVIAQRLRATDAPVEAVEVQVRGGGELFVRVRLRQSFIPPVIVGARIDQQPDLPGSPILGLTWWLPGMGALGALAGTALSFLKKGPPWLTVDGQRALVDVSRLLRDQGAGEFLAYLKSLRVDTRDGALVIRFDVKV
jgi:hypothetical protein